MTTLDEIAVRNDTDKGSQGHGYCGAYERHIVDPSVIVEVGVAAGNSLRTWREFYPRALVLGIEVNPSYVGPSVILGDATDGATWEMLEEIPDVIIDDGSHIAEDILATFLLAWPLLRVGGWYVIEDLETASHPEFGGEYPSRGPVGVHLDNLLRLAIDGVVELHVYEQIAFIKKLA